MCIRDSDTTAQKIPAKETVVNFGVSFRHLNVTEKIENPVDEIIPNIKPINDPFSKSPKAIITIPIVAISIDNQTFVVIFSFKNKKPNNAVINGIEARQSKVIAAVVFVMDHINVIIATPRPVPPIIPEKPILK